MQCAKSFKVKGIKGHARLQRNVTTAKLFKIINISAADCSIPLQFGKIFDHVTPDVLHQFKVKWSKVKVTT